MAYPLLYGPAKKSAARKRKESRAMRDERVSASAAERQDRVYGAFWQIWDEHSERLRRLSLRWLGNPADAEDALSATKLKVMAHFAREAPALDHPGAWLARLLYTACMDTYRSRGREDRWRERGGEPGELPFAEQIPASLPSPEQALLGREEGRRVVRLVRQLPPPWRQAFLARCVHSQSYSTIAHEAGATRENIRKRVQLARAYLRARL
jgi:RNA polymerase sigma-70 factor, ECF subfamily